MSGQRWWRLQERPEPDGKPAVASDAACAAAAARVQHVGVNAVIPDYTCVQITAVSPYQRINTQYNEFLC